MAVGVIVAVALVATGSEDSPDDKRPSESTKSSETRPTPSLSIPTRIPTRLPSDFPSEFPTKLPSDFPTLPTGLPSDLESLLPTPAGNEAP
ncbi:hypothetical protein AB0I46_40680 [Streptomyces spectabilis]|uniref:hypothetical protein n=1 Tax=Streptomyces spectabilis TaxID=68270 RepID=UPI003403C1AD